MLQHTRKSSLTLDTRRKLQTLTQQDTNAEEPKSVKINFTEQPAQSPDLRWLTQLHVHQSSILFLLPATNQVANGRFSFCSECVLRSISCQYCSARVLAQLSALLFAASAFYAPSRTSIAVKF